MTRLRSFLRMVLAYILRPARLLAGINLRDDRIANLEAALLLTLAERDEARAEAEVANSMLDRWLSRDVPDDARGLEP